MVTVSNQSPQQNVTPPQTPKKPVAPSKAESRSKAPKSSSKGLESDLVSNTVAPTVESNGSGVMQTVLMKGERTEDFAMSASEPTLVASAQTRTPSGTYGASTSHGSVTIDVSQSGSQEVWKIQRAEDDGSSAPSEDPLVDRAAQWLHTNDLRNGLPPKTVQIVGDSQNGGAMMQYWRGNDEGTAGELDRLDVMGEQGWFTVDRNVLDQLPTQVSLDNLGSGQTRFAQVPDQSGQLMTAVQYPNDQDQNTQLFFAPNGEKVVQMTEIEPGRHQVSFGEGADDVDIAPNGIQAFDNGTIEYHPDGNASSVNARGDIRRNYVPSTSDPNTFELTNTVEHLYQDGQPTSYRQITDAEGQVSFGEVDPGTGEIHALGTREETNGALQFIANTWGRANQAISDADENAQAMKDSDNPMIAGLGHLAGGIQRAAGGITDFKRNTADSAAEYWQGVHENIENDPNSTWGDATVAGGARVMRFLSNMGGGVMTPAALMDPNSTESERISGAITTTTMGMSAAASRGLQAFGQTQLGQSVSQFLNRPVGSFFSGSPAPTNVVPFPSGAGTAGTSTAPTSTTAIGTTAAGTPPTGPTASYIHGSAAPQLAPPSNVVSLGINQNVVPIHPGALPSGLASQPLQTVPPDVISPLVTNSAQIAPATVTNGVLQQSGEPIVPSPTTNPQTSPTQPFGDPTTSPISPEPLSPNTPDILTPPGDLPTPSSQPNEAPPAQNPAEPSVYPPGRPSEPTLTPGWETDVADPFKVQPQVTPPTSPDPSIGDPPVDPETPAQPLPGQEPSQTPITIGDPTQTSETPDSPSDSNQIIGQSEAPSSADETPSTSDTPINIDEVLDEALEDNVALADLLTSDQADNMTALLQQNPGALDDLKAITQNEEVADILTSTSNLDGIYLRQALGEQLVSPEELRTYADTQSDLSGLQGQTPEQMARTIKINGREDVVGTRNNNVHTPSGTVHVVNPDGDVYSVQYEDERHKHTRAANISQERFEQLLDGTAKKVTSQEQAVLNKLRSGEPSYGGQLTQEAANRYHELTREAMENGLWVTDDTGVTKVYYQFDDPIGVELGGNGNDPELTRWVRIDTSPGGESALHSAHIIPVTPPPAIQRQLNAR